MRRYGSPLLTALPVETTALLMELCLRDPGDPDPSGGFIANLADFTHLYADRPQDLQYACITILEMNPDSPSRQVLYHTLLDLYLGGTTTSTHGSTDSNRSSSQVPPRRPGTPTSQILTGGRRDALDLLKRGWPSGQDAAYDVDRALVVSRMHSFSEGLVFLYEVSISKSYYHCMHHMFIIYFIRTTTTKGIFNED